MLRYLWQRLGGSTEPHVHHNEPSINFENFVSYKQLQPYGYPQNPSCMSNDPELGLLAIGTKNGELIIAANSEKVWRKSFKNDSFISISFISGTYTLIVLSNSTNSTQQRLHKIIILNDGTIEVNTVDIKTTLKTISSLAVVYPPDSVAIVLFTTISGNFYQLDVDTMEMMEFILFEEFGRQLMKQYPEQSRSIFPLVSCKTHGEFLAGVIFKTHVIIVDVITKNIHFLSTNNNIEHLSFSYPKIDRLIVGFSNGSYSVYSFQADFSNITLLNDSVFLYGSEECSNILQTDYYRTENNEIIIFSGGLPKESYGDRNGITVKGNIGHHILDLDSKIVNLSICFPVDPVLFILCEQELAAIDLSNRCVKLLLPPYLYPMHFSSVTTFSLIPNLDTNIFKMLNSTDLRKTNTNFSDRIWPLLSNQNWPLFGKDEKCSNSNVENNQNLLITGHENGSIVFWHADCLNLKPMLIFQMAKEFEGFIENEDDNELTNEDNLPAFKRRGIYESFCDDPRFAISKIVLDQKTKTIAVGGRAGQVFIYTLDDERSETEPLKVLEADLVGNVQKSEVRNKDIALPPRRTKLKYPNALFPEFGCMIQMKPSTLIQTLACSSSAKLIAVGIEYGFIVCDLHKQLILSKVSLLQAEEILEISNNDGQLSRFKSMKKTIRQSFRRKRRSPTRSNGDAVSMIHNLRPVEREIVARPRISTNTCNSSNLLRILKFTQTDIDDFSSTDLLLVGTSSGVLQMYTANSNQKLREIRLKHQAPIVDATIHMKMLIIFTEEQICCFHVPSLKPAKTKHKFTAIEGSKIFGVCNLNLQHLKYPNKTEQFLGITSNSGRVYILSPGTFKWLEKYRFTDEADGIGIKTAAISNDGTLLWLKAGGSELHRATFAKTCVDHEYIY